MSHNELEPSLSDIQIHLIQSASLLKVQACYAGSVDGIWYHLFENIFDEEKRCLFSGIDFLPTITEA